MRGHSYGVRGYEVRGHSYGVRGYEVRGATVMG